MGQWGRSLGGHSSARPLQDRPPKENVNQRENFIHSFREIQPKFSRLYARILIHADLNLPQFALLSQLANLTRPLSMTEAGSRLGITKPAVTNLVDRLEKKGLLQRKPHTKDRRIFLLEIKPKGKILVRRVQGEALSVLLKTLEKFTGREKETVARFYELLSQALDGVLAKK